MARLSTQQPVLLERVIQDRGAAGAKRLSDVGPTVGRAIAEQTAAAPGAAYFCRRRASLSRAGDQPLDARGGHPRRQSLSVFPLVGDSGSHAIPVVTRQRRPHCRSRVPDALEAVEDVRVAVDVLLRDVPIVCSGIPWLTRVAENDPALEFLQVNVKGHPAYAVHFELEGRNPTIEGRPVV